MDSIIRPCSPEETSTNKIFQFPDLKPFHIRLPTSPMDFERCCPYVVAKQYESQLKMRRQQKYHPLLARIYEKEFVKTAEPAEMSQKEMRFSMLDRRCLRSDHRRIRSPEITSIYQDHEAYYVAHSNKVRILCRGVSQNNYPLVERLLNAGISPNCYDFHKRTPLHVAVSKGYYRMAQLLLDKGADPNTKDRLGNACLHLAACNNSVEMSVILMRGGANVSTVDYRGRSPLDLARSKMRLLSEYSDAQVARSKLQQVMELVLLFLEKKKQEQDGHHATLLAALQNNLQIAENPEQISNELDSLSKVLNQMESLTISK